MIHRLVNGLTKKKDHITLKMVWFKEWTEKKENVKKHLMSKDNLWMTFTKPGELLLKTTNMFYIQSTVSLLVVLYL